MTDAPGAVELRTFDAGAVTLRSGAVLTGAQLLYTVHGTLNPARDNAILLPTFYGGTHADNTYLIGPGRALDPERYCIVVPNMFANGVSTSPSNRPVDAGPFPLVSIADNVAVQHRLATEVLEIPAFALVIGFSMGGQQAYEWATRYPAMVRRLAVLCSAARTAPHTWVFLDGVTAALCAPGSLEPGSSAAEAGKSALARVWAGWGLSQAWFRERRYLQEGHASLEAFLRDDAAGLADHDARDLLAMIETWQDHDIGGPDHRDSDYAAALARITAACLVMPCRTDLYFPPEDSAAEVAQLPDARLAVIDSDLGHAAGGGADPADLAFIEAEVHALLAR